MTHQLTPGFEIDELRTALRASEQRRQQAECRLADRERQLGISCGIVAALDQEIAELEAELHELREIVANRTAEVLPHDDQLALISECGLRNEIWA